MMKNKYRIIKKVDGKQIKYYPQYKFMLFWFIPIWFYIKDGNKRNPQELEHHFPTQIEAEKFIIQKKTPYIRTEEIVKYL